MATRKKYKIVLSEKYVRKSENGKEWFQFPVNISGQLVAIQTIIPLDPYTEPDMEQVRKEAYEEGRKVGIKDGMCEAWEVARKVVGLETVNRRKVFGTEYMYSILENNTATEAIEKIRQYEQEKEEEIQVGDEVIATSGKAVIVGINDDKDKARYIYPDSTLGFDNICNLSKAGRHFPEIAAVLEKMKES